MQPYHEKDRIPDEISEVLNVAVSTGWSQRQLEVPTLVSEHVRSAHMQAFKTPKRLSNSA
jgi:hypothetical protein